jgi:AbrB family looped-hinge helix DNA binding protein
MIYGISKLYDKFKTTIPKKVREVLELEDGDELIYSNKNGVVVLTKNIDDKKERFKPL